MDGPRLTEERLRHHLDGNQPMRERMCLALLPLLGPYTREQPRRPKGGPDGGRDIEAVYQGQIVVWGAVGFKNGGGLDEPSRDETEKKFKFDLGRAMQENPTLAGFVFFTNVDLTPGRKEGLVRHANEKSVAFVEVFDMERLRHALDSPEGLIPRLQYLDIPMSPTEQIALVGKFGNQLHQAVTARFDRVERTLAQMEQFLTFQKPILRIDLYIGLFNETTSAGLEDGVVLVRVNGLHNLSDTTNFLCANLHSHPKAHAELLLQTHIWSDNRHGNVLTLMPSVNYPGTTMASFNELSLDNSGNRIRIADLTVITAEVRCTPSLHGKISRVAMDANGYELFNHAPDADGEASPISWPVSLPGNPADRKWLALVALKHHNFLFNPPRPSPRFQPISQLSL